MQRAPWVMRNALLGAPGSEVVLCKHNVGMLHRASVGSAIPNKHDKIVLVDIGQQCVALARCAEAGARFRRARKRYLPLFIGMLQGVARYRKEAAASLL